METSKFQNSKIFKLSESIEYGNGAIVSKVIIKKESSNLTLFAFDKGQGLSEHTAPFDAVVQIVEGSGQIIINKVPFNLNAGEFIIMPANVPHAVMANEQFKMLLIMVKG
ncbi:MAG: cupin [Bacteroidetes bacterium GWA2_32_17]|nr:MAG: cupin [Bacteroidetes bacterium GWA2_32_17]